MNAGPTVHLVESAPEGFRSYSTAQKRSLKAALAEARKRAAVGDSVVIVHLPAATGCNEGWLVGRVVRS